MLLYYNTSQLKRKTDKRKIRMLLELIFWIQEEKKSIWKNKREKKSGMMRPPLGRAVMDDFVTSADNEVM